MNDLISRQDAIDAMVRLYEDDCEMYGCAIPECFDSDRAINELLNLPSAEPLTDAEQRIFLKAISREEEVCRRVDAEWGEGDEDCEINLVHTCHEIVRKVKDVLWT